MSISARRKATVLERLANSKYYYIVKQQIIFNLGLCYYDHLLDLVPKMAASEHPLILFANRENVFEDFLVQIHKTGGYKKVFSVNSDGTM